MRFTVMLVKVPLLLSLSHPSVAFAPYSHLVGKSSLLGVKSSSYSITRNSRNLVRNEVTSIPQRSPLSSRWMTTEVDAVSDEITVDDNRYMKLAIEAAARGVGNTYPNPAVGCVLVSSVNDEIIGTGFHPRAGYPHAEVFALFEACGYVESGVESAMAVVENTKQPRMKSDASDILSDVDDLLDRYSSSDSANELFEGKLSGKEVTAYVTLEPCCHYGKTPPCALSLLRAGISRVIIGFRDPNPRVDGGGVLVLENGGVEVKIMSSDKAVAKGRLEVANAAACANTVSAFVKRISPRNSDEAALVDYDKSINGAKRSLLRTVAGRRKKEGAMKEVAWPSSYPSIDASDESIDLADAIEELPIHHSWLERVDKALWDDELILLRLNSAVQKKKGVKFLGQRIAIELKAHVAQVIGHTCLMYRPGAPPVLDLDPEIDP